ncbi:MAG: hypothetical protein A2X12_10695 [Bacteroidetes bacterium GWE2_29_8]|nr:MAG: hypothetical protein A2X12_10695 [Bacteroidetes bacterium GWE2_29_8]OFY24838.1 MAG: hypothetical protein A2X02_03835 [Bacteroidetes bacterium GWF2_29_10]
MNSLLNQDVKILYVEDQKNVRDVLIRILKRRFSNVYYAENGLQGLELFKQLNPDVVISDIKMPQMDGLAMIGEIRKINKTVKVILTTAHSDSEYFIASINLGVDQYILKPVDGERLFQSLDKCVKEINLTREIESKNEELIIKNIQLEKEIIERKTAESEKDILLLDLQSLNEELRTSGEELRQSLEYTLELTNKIAKSEADLRAIIDNTIQNHAFLDPDYKIIYLNKTADDNLLNYFNIELNNGDSFLDFVIKFRSEEEIEFFKQNFQKSLKGEKINYIKKINISDKTLYWDITYMPVYNLNTEEILGVSYSILDITEKKIAEEQILKLSFAVEQSANAIVITDIEGNIEYVNKFFTEITGYSFDEAKGQNPRILKSGDMPKEQYEFLWKTITEGKVWRGEFHNKKKNGDLYWEFSTIAPIFNENNDIVNYIAIKEDITEKRLIEIKLKENEKNLSEAQNLAKLGYWEINVKNNVIIINEETQALIGLSNQMNISNLEIPLNDFVENYIFDDDKYLFNERIDIYIQNIENLDYAGSYEIRIIKNDGNLINISVIEKSKGVGIYYGTCQDITERKQIEQLIVNALNYEKELNHLKNRFISTVSHEFRTPLHGITSNLYLLEKHGEKMDIEKKANCYRRMHFAIKNLTVMLDEITLMNKDQSGKLEFKPVKTNFEIFIKDLITDVFANYSLDMKLNLNVNTNLGDIYIDKSLLNHIFVNILSNAIKYSGNSKVVDANIIKVGDMIQFEINDYGIGISDNDLKRLFEPFFRAENVENIQGTGIGLSIIKRCVDVLEGSIDIESRVGEGTKIKLQIPILKKY